jgi:hypothetical protein
VEPSWREWVTGCSLAVIAGIGLATVQADAGGLPAAETPPPVTNAQVYPLVGQPSSQHGAAKPGTALRPQDGPAPAQAARRLTTDRGGDGGSSNGKGRGKGKGQKRVERGHN